MHSGSIEPRAVRAGAAAHPGRGVLRVAGARATARRAAGGLRLLAGSALLMGIACQPTAPPEPRIAAPDSHRVLAAGPVVGFEHPRGAHAWRGIPYAAPPAGEARWRAPRPLPAWDAERAALAPGAACPQIGSALGGPPGAPEGEPIGSEDCLFIDAWAPRWRPSEVPRGAARVPVMVWIHGGSNVTGSNAFYDGGRLAAEQGVVVFAINYRLGPFGWLRHEALRQGAADAAEASGNFGLLDMVRALEWVRENAAGFGGDPDNVTIFGESAGGQDVYALLLAPQARGLFHRAIVESGGLWMSTPEEAEHFVDDARPGDVASSNEMLVRALVHDGLAAGREEARAWLAARGAGEIAAWMRSRPAAQWITLYEQDGLEGLSAMPKVFLDGAVLPAQRPLDAFAAGAAHPVPLLVGTNRDENKLYLFFDDDYVSQLFGVLPRVRDPHLYDLTAEYLSRNWKARGADEPATAIARSRGAAGPPVYLYRFDWDEEPRVFLTDLSRWIGAAHGLEIPFVFGHFDLGETGALLFSEDNAPGREALSAAMRSYWGAFAHDGAPGRGRDGARPPWPEWSAHGEARFQVLDTPAGGGIRAASGRLRARDVRAAVRDDPRLRSDRERCWILHALVGRSEYRREDYAREPHCADHPYEAHPW